MPLTDAQLEELYDKQKLHENLMLYVRGIDRMDEGLMKSTYWPDSWDDHGLFIGPGQDWPAAGCTWRENVYNVNHHVSNVLVEVGGDQAKRESTFMVVTNQKEPAISFFLGGRYLDLCEKRDGEWRVLHRTCVWDWFESYPTRGGWELSRFPHNSNWGCFYPEDPVYSRDWTKHTARDFYRPATQFSYKKDM